MKYLLFLAFIAVLTLLKCEETVESFADEIYVPGFKHSTVIQKRKAHPVHTSHVHPEKMIKRHFSAHHVELAHKTLKPVIFRAKREDDLSRTWQEAYVAKKQLDQQRIVAPPKEVSTISAIDKKYMACSVLKGGVVECKQGGNVFKLQLKKDLDADTLEKVVRAVYDKIELKAKLRHKKEVRRVNLTREIPDMKEDNGLVVKCDPMKSDTNCQDEKGNVYSCKWVSGKAPMAGKSPEESLVYQLCILPQENNFDG